MTMYIHQDKSERLDMVGRRRNEFDFIHSVSEASYFFLRSRQSLNIHPKVIKFGEEAINYLLVQSLYEYSNDFVLQTQEFSQIKPLPFTKTIEIELLTKWGHEQLLQECHGTFGLIAVCLAEITLIKEIFSFISEEVTHHFFSKILEDYLAGKSRHGCIFLNFYGCIWQDIDVAMIKRKAETLPDHLAGRLILTVQVGVDSKVFISVKMPKAQKIKIFHEGGFGYFWSTKAINIKKSFIEFSWARCH